jgi:hypothetical protein
MDLTDKPFGGDIEAAVHLSGQVSDRIDSVKPLKEIPHATGINFSQ